MPKKKEEPTTGHNSNPQLKAFVDRIENIEGEIAALGEDRKEIYEEAKGAKIDVKALRRVIAIRKKDREEWLAQEEAVDAMLAALGML